MEKRQDLVPSQRAECYRAYAEQAIAYAKNASTEEIRQGYLKAADDWPSLVDSIDTRYGKAATSVLTDAVTGVVGSLR